MDLFKKFEPCTEKCNGDWLRCATEVLNNNSVSVESFAKSVRDLLEKGRGKYRNLMIVGPANCGKTFLLNPLSEIYTCFQSPATTSFAWVGAEKSEVIFLNDFRWSPQVLAWHDLLLLLEGQTVHLLLLLEGQTVHLPAPKTHCSKDIVFGKYTPIFCTSKHHLIFVKGGQVDEKEKEMMAVRWKAIKFNQQIPPDQQKEITASGHCFAELMLNYSK